MEAPLMRPELLFSQSYYTSDTFCVVGEKITEGAMQLVHAAVTLIRLVTITEKEVFSQSKNVIGWIGSPLASLKEVKSSANQGDKKQHSLESVHFLNLRPPDLESATLQCWASDYKTEDKPKQQERA